MKISHREPGPVPGPVTLDLSIGTRIAFDARGCDPTICRSEPGLRAVAEAVAAAVHATVLQVVTQPFDGGAFTVILILSASHCAVHSWPEHRLITVDLFACSARVDVPAAKAAVAQSTGADEVDETYFLLQTRASQ